MVTFTAREKRDLFQGKKETPAGNQARFISMVRLKRYLQQKR